jgi:hypothetical protein
MHFAYATTDRFVKLLTKTIVVTFLLNIFI